MVLTDNENLQANGNFVPVVREEVASEELGALLDSVTTTLTDEPATMYTLVALLVLAIVLDGIWKRVRSGRRTTATHATPSAS